MEERWTEVTFRVIPDKAAMFMQWTEDVGVHELCVDDPVVRNFTRTHYPYVDDDHEVIDVREIKRRRRFVAA